MAFSILKRPIAPSRWLYAGQLWYFRLAGQLRYFRLAVIHGGRVLCLVGADRLYRRDIAPKQADNFARAYSIYHAVEVVIFSAW